MKKRAAGVFFVLLIGVFCLFTATASAGGHNTATADRSVRLLDAVYQNYLAGLRLEALKTGNTIPEGFRSDSPPSMWLTKVDANRVNMATNRLADSELKAVTISGKTYFVAGDAYKEMLLNNPSVRFSRDPLTNRRVDKADAVVFADASGKVFYFESENTMKDFIALAYQGRVYGYTPPE